ncbi:cytochrome-c peroxidase [Colwelliaceae bacterium 6471]
MNNKLTIGGIVLVSLLTTLVTTNVNAASQPSGPNRPPRGGGPDNPPPPPPPRNNIDQRLASIVEQQNLVAISNNELNLPTIDDAKVQLGKKLFFTKNLGGEQSAACVSCHHPSLGGGDDLSLSVGVDAVDELTQSSHQLLGIGRFNGNNNENLPVVPRNAPSIFNIGLNNRGLFWDSRVETARNGGIFTPDSPTNARGQRQPDNSLPPGTTLASAQARFPVTSSDEMRGEFLASETNQTLRSALAQRFDNTNEDFITTWAAAFSEVFTDNDINFDRIADAIGEYERSLLFVDNRWNRYLSGETDALTDEEKAGAILFFTPTQQGGASCAGCHNGPTFSNDRHHLAAFPQIGVGKGNASETATSHDFGRENVTHDIADRYHFRTPSLLNVSVTAPYGHSGAYQTLTEVVAHYNDPEAAIDRLFAARAEVPFTDGIAPYCLLPQIAEIMQKNNSNCEDVFPDAYANSLASVQYLQQALAGEVDARAPLRTRPNLSSVQITQLVAFLNTLTDPCVNDRSCLAPWIIDENDVASFPDNQPLVGHDKAGNSL